MQRTACRPANLRLPSARSPLIQLQGAALLLALFGLARPAAPAEIDAGPVKLKPYGFIKTDAAYDSQETNSGGFALFVEPEDGTTESDQFSLSARATRLGLDLAGPPAAGADTLARVELDFYGSAMQDNKSGVLLRHAYAEMKWERARFLFGQTFDVLSPLWPDTLNYTVGWAAGNIGYRRPQVRYERLCGDPKGVSFLSQASVNRTISPETLGTHDPGQTSGFPTVEAREAVSLPVAGRPLTFGVSGHYGEEDVEGHPLKEGATGLPEESDSWSAAGDLSWAITPQLQLKAELFTGEHLDSFLGAINQGVNMENGEAISALGGWAQLGYDLAGPWKANAGCTLDDPDDDDLAAGMRARNQSIYGNLIYEFNAQLSMGAELSHWTTDYLDKDEADAVRVQWTGLYRF